MSALRKRINYLQTKIAEEQQTLHESSLFLKNKLNSPVFIFAGLIGSVGLGYFLVRHTDPKAVKAKMVKAPAFFMKLFKHAELLLPLIL